MKSLRTYPLPYVCFRLDAKDIQFAADMANECIKLFPDIRSSNRSYIQDRVAASLAFANVYGFEDDFIIKPIESWRYDQGEDFQVPGSGHIKIITSRINEKRENTGARTSFRISTTGFSKSKANTFVLAAIHSPYVQFLGWVERDELSKSIKGWSAKVYAGLPCVRSMADLITLEDKRKKGLFV